MKNSKNKNDSTVLFVKEWVLYLVNDNTDNWFRRKISLLNSTTVSPIQMSSVKVHIIIIY